ncbi:MAG: recombinase family protein, partial [Burkholderia gladioli]
HRRLHCVTYCSSSGCKVSGSCSVAPVERALMLYCSDQMNLTRLLEGDSGVTALHAELAHARAAVADLERQIGRVTDALLTDEGQAPAALLKRMRDMESDLERERHRCEALELRVHAAASAEAPAAADAWSTLARGVEELDYDARMQARQLVADTFSRIVVYQAGFYPETDDGLIGLMLIAKRGSTRMLHVDRKTGEWRSADDLSIEAELPLPLEQ